MSGQDFLEIAWPVWYGADEEETWKKEATT